MAISIGESGEPRLHAGQPCPVFNQRANAPADLGALHRFGAQQSDLLGMVGDARRGIAQVGFAALLVEIEGDQAPSDKMRDQQNKNLPSPLWHLE